MPAQYGRATFHEMCPDLRVYATRHAVRRWRERVDPAGTYQDVIAATHAAVPYQDDGTTVYLYWEGYVIVVDTENRACPGWVVVATVMPAARWPATRYVHAYYRDDAGWHAAHSLHPALGVLLEEHAALRRENVRLAAQLTFHRQEIRAVIDHLPPACVVPVREGGGPENVCATLAVSCAKLAHLYKEQMRA